MFELLSNVQTVPIDPDSLAMVHRGMNKVRVSVGDHVSEPSEVYIISGRSNGNLETYIIFYMVGPGIHVVYGCDQNPYAPELKEQVIEEAINFVEEMGSILEEVPWETMTPDQRSAWIEKEILYSVSAIEELEEIETVEVMGIEDGATDEVELEEDPAIDPAEGVVEISNDEVRQALSESGSDESLPVSEGADAKPIDAGLEPDDIDEDDVAGVDAAGMEDVVVAEGDFDEFLKQAFLKPEVAEKTKLKKAKKKAVNAEEEEPVQEGPADDEDDSVMVEDEADVSGAGENVGVEEELEVPGELEAAVKVESELYREEKAVDAVKTFPGAIDSAPSEKDTRLKVIRFLSRF